MSIPCNTALILKVIREHIARHGGYEINTEGDSFHIAFSSVAQAVFFAMDTQYRLLETNWPREVLKLSDCGEVHDKDGILIMKGPRVRMGIHFAAEGTVAQRWAGQAPRSGVIQRLLPV